MRTINDRVRAAEADQSTWWLFHVLRASDSMFPSGSYAHSFALEGLVQDGSVCDEITLSDYLEHAFLPAVIGADVPIAHGAWKAAAIGDVARLLELDDLANTLRPTRELRDASRRTGLQRLRTSLELKPHKLVQDFLSQGGIGHAAVVIGMESALWQVPARAAMYTLVYQAIAGQVAAACKLIPLGQMAAQRILCDRTARVHAELGAAMHIAPEDAGWFTPLQDIASAKHERAYARLFIS